jgi:hypothetical protein
MDAADRTRGELNPWRREDESSGNQQAMLGVRLVRGVM